MKKTLRSTEFRVQAFMWILAFLFSYSLKAQYNYLGTYDNNGKPNYLVNPSDIVNQSFLDDVDASLPESKPVPIYNPQYISAGTATDIQLTDSAAVWVTFVAEGAGYRNVLGFYTYDLANPPQTVAQIVNETIIFPNVSARFSGGDLMPGDKVKLGDFSPGTGIGWFLIANGWNGSAVGNGYWKVYSNTDFNPESNASDRNHNVLLNDAINERIALGFEDIRRDYASCDQDFNDAIFYVSANPYTAIATDKINTITDAGTSTGSGGNGGLESNGDLASRIAQRNFKRKKVKSTDYNKFDELPRFDEFAQQMNLTKGASRNKSSIANLNQLLPTSSLFNSLAYETTPTDLLQITNAQEIFAVDYVANDKRKGAAMVMYTQNKVYEHTKVVCDRLNGAELLDIYTLQIEQHPFIFFKLKQADGAVEYAVNYVVQKQTNGNYIVDNNWALGDYQNANDNLSFQLWSSSQAMTVQLLIDALNKLEQQGTVSFLKQTIELPKVYVKKGNYKNGKLYLTVANLNGSSQIELKGTLSKTETSGRTPIQQLISLDGTKEQTIEIQTGTLFDVGFELGSSMLTSDVLYAADGAWGTDFETEGAILTNYNVSEQGSASINHNNFSIERGIQASGMVKNYVSFFKNLNPNGAEQSITSFNAIQFDLESNQVVELTIVRKCITSWSEQFRVRIAAQKLREQKTIYLSDFKNSNGDKFVGNDVESVVFSIKSDGVKELDFEIKVENVAFVEVEKSLTPAENEATLFPNPMTEQSTFSFNAKIETSSQLQIINMKAKVVFEKTVDVQLGINRVSIQNFNLKKGTYIVIMRIGERLLYEKLIVA